VSYTLPIGLTATVGARYSDIEHSIFRGANGLPNFRSAFTAFAAKSKPWTYKAELSYRFKDFADFVSEGLLYANYREGFRNGFGITPPPPTCAAGLAALGLVANSQVDPDTVNTYEGGAKLTLKRGVVANMAVYHTDWDNIQSTFGLPCGFTISGNFGKAEIDGVEMDFAARPLDGLDVGISTAYTEAVYTQKAPGVSPSTNRLPFTPKWAVNANVRYTFPILDGQRSAYVAADAQYMSNRIYNSQGLARLREYHNLNLRAGVLMGAWDAQVYVQNVFDRYFIVGQPLAIPGENRVAPNRPRTIGVTATYHFQ
jgi:outer membrane receptor for monomeric catechols